MQTGCFIPIKKNSERVKGKNFRRIKDKKLYEYIIINAHESNIFDQIFIDTDSQEVKDFCTKNNLEIEIINRKKELATNSANGNDLLIHHQKIKPNFDYYFQLFATAPFLKSDTIKQCVEIIIKTNIYDSIFTAIPDKNFYWFENKPVNYRPGVLPRSQDLTPMYKETTGLYGIKSSSLKRFKCRIGSNPYIYECDHIESIDIDTEEDLEWARWIAERKL